MLTKSRKTHIWGILLLLLTWLATMLNTGSASAAPTPPSGPDRYTSITVDYITYKWWLLEWEDSDLVCEINIEHEGLPTLGEVYIDCGEGVYAAWVDCGEGVYAAWVEQEACHPIVLKEDTSQCPGYYLHLAASELKEREIAMALPPPVIWLTLEGCTTESTTNRCERPPTLVLRGDEPLSGEKITRITGAETDNKGITLTFWAYSSYGDSSHVFDARLRVSLAEDEEFDRFWYVDILSPQWRGEANASCAEIWDTLPPIGGVPEWLSTPQEVSELKSDISYTYLAGNLISRHIVDAADSKLLNLR